MNKLNNFPLYTLQLMDETGWFDLDDYASLGGLVYSCKVWLKKQNYARVVRYDGVIVYGISR